MIQNATFVTIICLFCFVLVKGNDPKFYDSGPLYTSSSFLNKQHKTHNERLRGFETERIDNSSFIGSLIPGLVHRYVIKVKDNLFHDDSGVKNQDLTDTLRQNVLENSKIKILAEGHGFRYVKPIPSLQSIYIFERSVENINQSHFMEESADIDWFSQLFEPLQRVKRIFKDNSAIGLETSN